MIYGPYEKLLLKYYFITTYYPIRYIVAYLDISLEAKL